MKTIISNFASSAPGHCLIPPNGMKCFGFALPDASFKKEDNVSNNCLDIFIALSFSYATWETMICSVLKTDLISFMSEP